MTSNPSITSNSYLGQNVFMYTYKKSKPAVSVSSPDHLSCDANVVVLNVTVEVYQKVCHFDCIIPL